MNMPLRTEKQVRAAAYILTRNVRIHYSFSICSKARWAQE